MSIRKKLLTYATGFLLGLCILSIISFFKNTNNKNNKVSLSRSISFAELKNKRPLDPTLALFFIETPLDSSDCIQRVLIFDRAGPSGFLKVEEILELRPNKLPLLINRKATIADHMQIRVLRECTTEDLKTICEACNCTLVPRFSIENKEIDDDCSFTIKLPSHSIKAHSMCVDTLKRYPVCLSCDPITISLD